jgi:hypothetical protein
MKAATRRLLRLHRSPAAGPGLGLGPGPTGPPLQKPPTKKVKAAPPKVSVKAKAEKAEAA